MSQSRGNTYLLRHRAGLPASTLRYYNKEGLFFGMERTSGICRFTEDELKRLYIIECQVLEAEDPEYPPVQAVVCAGQHHLPQRQEFFLCRRATSEASLLMSCDPSAAFTR